MRFDDWIHSRNPALANDAHTPSAWTAVLLGVCLISGILYFSVEGFPVVTSLLVALPMFCMGVPLVFLVQKTPQSLRSIWALELLQSSAMTFWFAWLARSTLGEGMAGDFTLALLIFVTSFHAYQYGVTIKFWYGAVALTLPILGVFALETSPLFLVLATFWFILGDLGQKTERSRREAENETVARAVDEETQRYLQAHERITEYRIARHDMRNLLMVLDGNTSILEATLPEKDAVKRLRKSVDALSGSLDLSDSDRQEAEASKIHVLDLTTSVVEGLRTQFPHVDLKIKGYASDANMLGGATCFQRVLSNLAINAIQGNGKQKASKISVNLYEEDKEAVIEIRDNGPGFPQSMIEQGVVKFKTTKTQGSGLGMYTSKKLLEASRGSLALKNHPTGAQVTLRVRKDVFHA